MTTENKSKLADWIEKATENKLFVSAVAAAIITTGIYITPDNNEVQNAVESAYSQSIDVNIPVNLTSLNEATEYVKSEVEQFLENYDALSVVLKEGDRETAISIVQDMKDHLADLHMSTSALTHAEKKQQMDNATILTMVHDMTYAFEDELNSGQSNKDVLSKIYNHAKSLTATVNEKYEEYAYNAAPSF